MKKYILIAGVNGAGKSTLYYILNFPKKIHKINTDDIVREFGSFNNPKDVVKAGRIAVKLINEYFESGESFNQETTLCGKSIINNIIRAKELGYTVEVHYVGVESVEIAKKRISYRVEHGGHGIPDKDVERRYKESFKQLLEVWNYCDTLAFYDNTKEFSRFAVYKNKKVKYINENVPNWFEKYILEQR